MFDPVCEDQIGITINEIKVGDAAVFSKTLTEADAYQFSGIIGNFNPLHVNKEFCAKTPLGQRTVPTILVASMVSKILGTQLPGNGTVHVAQDMDFILPVFIGDTVSCRIEVTRVDGKSKRVWFDVTCVNQKGEVVAQGETEAIPPACTTGRK